MKLIDQILHQTETFEKLKSILVDGLFTSYNLEQFADKKILIPMISFSNVLFRDIGENEVIDYGSYGISIKRQFAIDLGLNPVLYVYDSSIIQEGIKYNFESSILTQTLDIIKDFYVETPYDKITDQINFNPISSEIKDLLNSIDKNTDDNLIASLRNVFGKIFENSNSQILFAKPYMVLRKNGEPRIAYNEREWRKTFLDLNFITEFKPNGESNPKFKEWINKKKPHLNDYPHILKIPIEKMNFIFVENENEIDEIKDFLNDLHIEIPKNLIIDTLSNLKKIENEN